METYGAINAMANGERSEQVIRPEYTRYVIFCPNQLDT